jgi:hypothetical protein
MVGAAAWLCVVEDGVFCRSEDVALALVGEASVASSDFCAESEADDIVVIFAEVPLVAVLLPDPVCCVASVSESKCFEVVSAKAPDWVET